MGTVIRSLSAILGIAAVGAAPAFSQDWPQWRGPNRDGVVHGVAAPAKWPRTLTEDWSVVVGEGVASPVVVGKNVYVFTRQKENEVVSCFDLETGKKNWSSQPYSAPYEPGLGEGNFSNGPRSTPTVFEGKVYTIGLSGVLSCFDAKTGDLRWRKECKPYLPYGGASPLVVEGSCIIQFGDNVNRKTVGGLTAFDAATGDVKWLYSDGSRASSSSPILVDLAGERQVVLFNSWELLGVSFATGKKLWSLNTFSPHESLIVTPILYEGMLIAAGNKEPPRALRLEKEGKGIKVTEIWKAQKLPLHMSTPVLSGNRLFGMSTAKRGCFFCLDAKSGRVLWESDGDLHGSAAILNAGSVWMALTVKGKLIVIKPSETSFEPIAEYTVSEKLTWAHPVFLGNRVLIKDATSLKALRIQEGNNK